jgi:hypothetical protein
MLFVKTIGSAVALTAAVQMPRHSACKLRIFQCRRRKQKLGNGRNHGAGRTAARKNRKRHE